MSALPVPTRVPITFELLEKEDFPYGIPSAASAPERLRLEIDIWLCRNGCAGWRLVRHEIRLDRPDLGFPVYQIEHFIDFSDPDDAFWFRVTWT